MPNLILHADRVKDVTTTTGTGNVTLSGTAPTGFQSFNTAFSTSTFFYYVIEGGAEWEVGEGHLSAATTLVRDTVLASSNAGAAVNFSAGTKNVFSSIPSNFFTRDWVTYGKSATTNRNTTTTTTADPDLQATVIANATYLIDFYAQFHITAAIGYKYKFTSPSTTSFFTNRITTNVTTLTADVGATLTTDTSLTGSGTGALRITGVYVVGVTGGTFSFDWSQDTSSGTNIGTFRGSYLSLKRILG